MQRAIRGVGLAVALVLSVASGGGGSSVKSGFVNLPNHRAPDEWFESYAKGATKLGCEVQDKTEGKQRMRFARCPSKNMIGVMMDYESGFTAMCDAIDKTRVTDPQCATFMDETMNLGRQP